jgi:hypothetical protein
MLTRPVRRSLGCLSFATLLACGSSGTDSGPPSATAGVAGIQMRFNSTTAASGGGQSLLAFAGGGAARPGLESLEYFITGVQICESMQASGSAFNNPSGCIELYRNESGQLNYDLGGDWTPLADAARATTSGFVDLLDPASRQTLNARTELTSEQVRSYNYGIITWSLPIKVKASIPLGDGTFLYTHDGETTFETIGNDNFRHYFTAPSAPLTSAPAEKAVVLLGNGGNWFKFQNPLTVTRADIDERRQWVLDLVFNPDGIVKGFAGGGSVGSIQEKDGSGFVTRAVTVPMLDLAPIPHRENEQVVRESYLASLSVGPHAFDLRLELYSIDGDPAQTIYGADVKSLVTAASTTAPPDMSKVSFVAPAGDGSVTFQSFNQSPIISGFRRVSEVLGTTTASIQCATHGDRARAEGGAAIVIDQCPSANIEVIFRLVGRTLLDGELPSSPSPAPSAQDAGVNTPGPTDAATPDPDAAAPGPDAATPDASPDAAL